MRLKTTLVAGLAFVWSSFGASAALIEQGVTFTFNDLGGNVLRLTIDDILNATGDWAPVNFFDGFDIKDVGSFSAAIATYAAGPQSESGSLGQQVNGSGVGCNNGGGASACFDWTPNLALTNHMVIDIAFTPSGGGLDFSNPHLKVAFLVNDNDTKKTGDLLSQNFASDPVAVPGPLVGAGLPGLMAACIGLIAWARRRRGTHVANAALRA